MNQRPVSFPDWKEELALSHASVETTQIFTHVV